MPVNSDYKPAVLDEDKVFDDLNTYRWVNLVFHLLRLIVALVLFALCAWVRFDLDFRVWVPQMDWYTYWYCMYVIWIAASAEIVVSILGAWAVLKDGRGILLFCMISMGILMFVELIGGVMICIYGVEESPTLITQLNEKLLRMVYAYDYDFAAQKTLKQIMEYVGCCGADGSDDFIKALKPVPFECRDMITGVEFAFGCQQQLAWWLEPWTASLAALAFFFVVTDVFGIFSNRRLRRLIWEFRSISEGQQY